MNSDLISAKELFEGGGYTCVLCKGEEKLSSTQSGIKPLLELLKSETDLKGFSAADKIIGRAAAFLYVLMGVSSVYGKVITSGAIEILRKNSIEVYYETCTEKIINRKGDDICPMEKAVADIDEPLEAYKRLALK